MSIRKTAARLGGWALGRAREKSTWAGLAIVAGVIGGPAAGLAVSKIGTVAGLLLGAGLASATTKPAA